MAGCVVWRLPIDGFGLFAKENICLGQRICEYVGEVCTGLEARIREAVYRQRRSAPEYIKKIEGNGLWIDPTFVGNRAKLVNHSCDANVEFEEVEYWESGFIKMYLRAKRDIGPGEELLDDYGWRSSADDSEVTEMLIQICACESANCRKVI